MPASQPTRRQLLAAAGAAGLAAASPARTNAADSATERGGQRLGVERLQRWEALGYGMFIHYGMSTFVGQELPSGKDPLSMYAPTALDVDQWISVARDAGMKYAVLTTKHVAGHCLWPTKYTSYSVVNSPDTTDVVERFCKACEKRGVLPGLYYCSWDNHNRFGSMTPSDPGRVWRFENCDYKGMLDRVATRPDAPMPAFTTSTYQSFQTKQLTELLTQYGPIAETWIDIPAVLGRGYREYLYGHVAGLQPDTVIMMNNGFGDGSAYPVDSAWPADIMALERCAAPTPNWSPWRQIEGKRCYLPGEMCDPIGKNWFWVDGDNPRPDAALAEQFNAFRSRGVNVLLNVPPDRRGVIPDMHVQALMRLRKNVGI